MGPSLNLTFSGLGLLTEPNLFIRIFIGHEGVALKAHKPSGMGKG